MSKIIIKGCTDPLLWYLDKMGESFEVIRDWGDSYLVTASDGHSNKVYKKDCELAHPIKYTTAELYGVESLKVLKGEVKFIKIRLELLHNNLKFQNAKDHMIKDSALIAEILKAENFWNARIKEIES